MPDLVIILIHGTGARGAPWTQPDAPLWEELRHRFGDRAIIDRWDWSGSNNAWARIVAGRELAEHIDETRGRHPGAKVILIAHSHGGNVALYAAQGSSVDGIACLATPFINAAPRNVGLYTGKVLQGAIFGVFSAAFLIPAMLFGVGWAAWLAVTIIIYFAADAVAGYFSVTMNVIADVGEEFAQESTARVPRGTHFRIFRVTGDEANMVLATGQMLSWLSGRIYTLYAIANDPASHRGPIRDIRIPMKYWLTPVWCLMLVLAGLAIAPMSEDVGPFIAVVGAYGLTVSLVLLFLVRTRVLDHILFGMAFLFLMVTTLVGANLIGTVPPATVITGGRLRRAILGFQLFIAVDIATEATPPGGDWSIRHFNRYGDPEPGDAHPLAHSVYNHPGVRDAVIEWIELCTIRGSGSPVGN